MTTPIPDPPSQGSTNWHLWAQAMKSAIELEISNGVYAVDNGDGTLTISGNNVIDNSDGTFTLVTN